MNTDTAFKSVRAYYFRDACAKSRALLHRQANWNDLRAVWKRLTCSPANRRSAPRANSPMTTDYVAREAAMVAGSSEFASLTIASNYA